MFNYLNMKYFYIFIFFLIISTNSNHVHAEDLSSTTPADNATQIAVNTDITLVWAGNVSTNSGNVILKKTSDDSTVESFATGSMFLISDMSGNVSAIINPSSDLDEDTEYYVLIDSSAFNNFDGISSKTTLNFKTVDNNNPSLSSSSPSDNATDLAVDANIVLNFDEAVDAESGNITIKKTSDDSTVETIDVTGAKVSGSGGTEITINPGSNLQYNKEYYVLIDATAFDDTSGNSYAGISSTTALSFTTDYGEVFNETVKTLTKNQSAAAVNSVTQSLSRISNRMNFIRPINNNTSNQNIKLAMNFDDPFANQILNSLSAKYLIPKKETKGWAVWTEGNITFGRVANHDGNLGQDIHSDGITMGLDKKTTKNKTVGFAVNRSWQETEVGSNDANMDATSTTIMTYRSSKIKDKTYLETAFGIGEMDIDLDRSVTGGRNAGVRKGNQLFGSFTYLLEPGKKENEDITFNENEDNTNFNYYTRLDLSFTQLDGYTESGDGDSVKYNKQNVKSASLSAGFNLNKVIKIEKGFAIPLLKFEIGKDQTKNSLSEAYYVSDSSTIYSNAIGHQSSGHAIIGLGLGAQLENNLTINISYDHYRNSDEAFMNSFTINFRKLF